MNHVETDCTITHEGHDFTANGSWRVDDVAGYYVDGKCGLTTWDGQRVGRYSVVSSWKQYTPHGYYWMESIRATLDDGSLWHGRYNADWSQLVKLRRCKS